MTERAVSVTLDYILMLMIATVLFAGIVSVSGILIDGQVEAGLHDELTATGEKLAADIQDVERLYIASGSEASINLTSQLPAHVGGHQYSITVDETGEALELATSNPDVVVIIPIAATQVSASEAAVPGGTVTIVAQDDVIEVRAG